MPVKRLVALATLAIGVAFLSTAPMPAKAGLLLVVDSTADTSDNAPGDGVCDGGGACTLRAAIEEANATPGADAINFEIGGCIDFNPSEICEPGSFARTIAPVTPLPAIFPDPVTIDGTTEPGFAGTPIIELNGTNAGTDATGLIVVS